MTSMLEKSDESYVFSRSDCISHFSPPVLFDISFGVEFCIEFSTYFDSLLVRSSYKKDMKMNGDFHIDFL